MSEKEIINGKYGGRFATISGCLIITLFLGVTDYLTGPYLAFSVFYLIPVMVATWRAGLVSGVAVAVVAALIWFAADKLDPLNYPHFLVPYWNTFVRLMFFLVSSYLLDAVKKAFEREKLMSRTDALTGAENSRSFYETADAEIERMRRRGVHLSVAYIDVDNFKHVNDTLGHSVGDKLLSMVVHTMKDQLRKIDVVARLGGDEFAALMPETNDAAAAKAAARLKDKLDAAMKTNRWPVTFSIGVVSFSVPPFSVNEMIREADLLMYEVKNGGKDAVKTKSI